MRLVLHPLPKEVVCEPGAPLDLQHLEEPQAIHCHDDPDDGEQAELAELAEKLGLIAVLEGVVEVAIPVVELHFHVDHGEREPHHGDEQRERLGAPLGDPVWLGKGPESL